MICPSCGKNNPSTSAYCCQCGERLAESSKDESTTILTPVETDAGEEVRVIVPEVELACGEAMFVVKRGPNAGARFLLDKDVTTAGRHPESDIFLDDITVSRRHVEIRKSNGFKAVDMGSLNGTYVNKSRVEEVDLSSGDEVQIGKFKLIFLCK
ncbi:MAG: hypothetical protein CVT63_00235 [Candidatus Anoxymicrobium japonicum]|uniref:FHA domain-containing protein n=1 Tax=Candidatus Anoxymicrobium japonicum TaxID=2013648 RepID=A0A2N3G866_9ACTN|nr:MAG: hypothetical protein CVT63_00235 [Candidatus Anoxymicrobium japonicum]